VDPNVHESRRGFSLKLILIGAAATASSPAFAQYPPPGSVAPPGSIIISRDVPQRPAFAPGQPGTVHPVETAPVALIFGATSQTVSILTDDETSNITTGANGMGGTFGTAFDGAHAALNPQLGSGPGQVAAGSLGGGLGSTISNTINTATGAIGRALAPFSGGKGD